MPKISNILKQDWLIIIMILMGFALGAYFYPSLPDKVPIHWNMNGAVNGYGSRLFGAFGLPTISLATYLMYLVIPHIDPKRKNYADFKSTYQLIRSQMVITTFSLTFE